MRVLCIFGCLAEGSNGVIKGRGLFLVCFECTVLYDT